MSSSFVLKTTPTFERGFRALTRRDRELQEQFIKLVEVLRLDPYNIGKQHDIKNSLMWQRAKDSGVSEEVIIACDMISLTKK